MSNPRPNFGWMTKITAGAIIALTLVAALRTAFSFGLSAFTSLNQFLSSQIPQDALLILSGLEAFAAVLGIEGFIIATGMKDGMRKKEDELKAPRAIASYILLAVSCAAGMFQNASMLGNQTLQTSEWVLMLITALGVPVSLMFAAPYLGLMMNFQNLENQKWLDMARESFNGMNINRLAMSEVNMTIAE